MFLRNLTKLPETYTRRIKSFRVGSISWTICLGPKMAHSDSLDNFFRQSEIH